MAHHVHVGLLCSEEEGCAVAARPGFHTSVVCKQDLDASQVALICGYVERGIALLGGVKPADASLQR